VVALTNNAYTWTSRLRAPVTGEEAVHGVEAERFVEAHGSDETFKTICLGWNMHFVRRRAVAIWRNAVD